MMYRAENNKKIGRLKVKLKQQMTSRCTGKNRFKTFHLLNRFLNAEKLQALMPRR